MIHFYELVRDHDYVSAPLDHKANLHQLHYKLNFIRTLYANPIMVNSGYRTREDHFRIYNEINKERGKKGLEELTIPWKSNHLIGAAADLHDPFGSLKKWILENLHIAEELNLHFERFEDTGGIDGGWIHAQIYPPKSGLRFFKP